ncbi:type I pantothenate kinase [Mechercharimyces sp. CAU 1602]|uniref:type I pantothenate kinase n=1 Tax=Mechercharimyces sp. CAU 1602 TaxID=2973933 RepID=UPI0021614935|nr:type I pantothenate kinase [Mechercharimyces sp. CAU 1602]MCS1350944.1 type I pantothenate kinase [Mechercharimyces sp. CAU 1602]
MDKQSFSPYLTFSKEEWAELRFHTPMTITESELEELRGINESVSISEVENIYLPLTRLINLYTTASQQLHAVTDNFFARSTRKVPYMIGIAGSVAVGKSTTARIIRALLARWPNHPSVEIITTDGFLYPNAVLEEKGLMERKGFPESFNLPALIACLDQLKAGIEKEVEVPLYSHHVYDVLESKKQYIYQPDIVIVEGINVLQVPQNEEGTSLPSVFVSDFFDLSIYVDAKEEDLHSWYTDRFKKLRATSFSDPDSYFHRFATLSDEEAESIATDIWNRINYVNLKENIEPTRRRGDIILKKARDHSIEQIHLRKI